MKTIDDYPYDPTRPLSDVHIAQGLDKLRLVRDRALAKQLFDLWHHIHEPARQATVSRVAQERKREDQLDVARRSHSGKLGNEEQDLAIEVFGLTFGVPSNEQLRGFFRALSALRQARANRVTGEAA